MSEGDTGNFRMREFTEVKFGGSITDETRPRFRLAMRLVALTNAYRQSILVKPAEELENPQKGAFEYHRLINAFGPIGEIIKKLKRNQETVAMVDRFDLSDAARRTLTVLQTPPLPLEYGVLEHLRDKLWAHVDDDVIDRAVNSILSNHRDDRIAFAMSETGRDGPFKTIYPWILEMQAMELRRFTEQGEETWQQVLPRVADAATRLVDLADEIAFGLLGVRVRTERQ